MGAPPVAILFTDLVSSTELLQRAGDESAQRIFQAHHTVLKAAAAATGGREVRWMGDGLMVAFASAADAVRCATAMQQAARRPIGGERLAIRVGLNAGEVLAEETDYFGLSVVIARRLCDRARGGQILCSRVVAGLLEGRPAFRFADRGALELKGIASPVATCEVLYEREDPAAILSHPPFVGRTAELAALQRALDELRGGRGGLVLLMGEPGIGKTRTLEECVETARAQGAAVLWGRCYEGEAARPYGPFAEALADYARRTPADTLRADLGLGAAVLARVAPGLREQLPDLPEPVALQPDEERVRLLDAVVQWLLALAARAPTVLVLDDLHWAEAGTVALLRHAARFAPRVPLLLLGAYRDMDVERTHPLHDALGALPRETRYEQIGLAGLEEAAVQELLETLAEREVPPALVASLTAETSGNPFFLREVLLHLAEQGRLVADGEGWRAPLGIAELGLPDSLRQVIGRRVGRLSPEAHRLLTAGAACSGAFQLTVAGRVAGIEEARALDAVDEALATRLLRPGSTPESYEFTHALIRHTLYAALNPSRQVRLHRQLAEAMEQVYGERPGEHAAEIARHYHRSASLPGAERGVGYALMAADRAAAAYAHDDTATFLRIALELMPQSDGRKVRLLGRLAMTIGWALHFDEALHAAIEAGDLIADAEGDSAAADYFAQAAMAMWRAGSQRQVWALASHGLRYIGARRDMTWVQLMVNDIVRREGEEAGNPGIVMDTPERRAVTAALERLPPWRSDESLLLSAHGFIAGKSRQDILDRLVDTPYFLMSGAGEYRRCVRIFEESIAQYQREGCIANTVAAYSFVARCHNALGALAAARTACDHGAALAQRLRGLSQHVVPLIATTWEQNIAVDDGWERFPEEAGQHHLVENHWLLAAVRAQTAWLLARLGKADEAMLFLQSILEPLERAPGWALAYEVIPFNAAGTLWLLQRTDHIEPIERNLREKILAPDFRYPMVDARLSMAHLSALQRRYDEAVEWFAKGRSVLDEQGARPLRAITDFDEAWMYVRRGMRGDAERAHPLLDAALAQFHAIGMPGWIKRAEALADEIARPPIVAAPLTVPPTQPVSAAPERSETALAIFRQEGEYWTIAYEADTFRLKDARGLAYLAYLLRHPGTELHALELVRAAGGQEEGGSHRKPATSDQEPAPSFPGDAGELLDPQAKADYKRRLDDLHDELEEARGFNDAGRVERLQQEIEFLTQELARAVGLGGRARRAGSHAERARVNVTRAIALALKKIGAHSTALAGHLTRTVKTGTFCSYDPDPHTRTHWQF